MRRHPRLVAIGVGALLISTFGLAACSSPTVEDTSTQYCDSLDTISQELGTLADLIAADATLEELAAQRDAVRASVTAAKDAGADLDAAASAAADDAGAAFSDAVDAIPGGASLSDATAGYSAAVDAYEAELAAIVSDAGCS